MPPRTGNCVFSPRTRSSGARAPDGALWTGVCTGRGIRAGFLPAQHEARGRVGSAHRPQGRHCREQRLGVGVLGRVEDPGRGSVFDLFAADHDDDTVGDLGDDAHVVRDEKHRHVHLVLKGADQLENLRLDRHVERRRRLVGDQQARFARQRHRDHHALSHAAG